MVPDHQPDEEGGGLPTRIPGDSRRAIEAMPATDTPDFERLLDHLCLTTAPRRFALCEVDDERREGWVTYWGLAFDKVALLMGPQGDYTGRFESAERITNLLSGTRPMRIRWIDASEEEEEGCEVVA
jgi:hypothetical protein